MCWELLLVVRTRQRFTGALVGAGAMFYLGSFTAVNGYLYTASGIITCFVVGFIASLFASGPPTQDLTGLTMFTLHRSRLAEPE